MLANRRALLLLVVQQVHLVKQAEIVDVIVDTQHLLMIDVRAHQRQVDVGARAVVALRARAEEYHLADFGMLPEYRAQVTHRPVAQSEFIQCGHRKIDNNILLTNLLLLISQSIAELLQQRRVVLEDKLHDTLRILLVIGMRHQRPVFGHLSPGIVVVYQSIRESLAQGAIRATHELIALIFQQVLHHFPCQLIGELEPLYQSTLLQF